MPLFYTKYDCPDMQYPLTTTIYARDRQHAEETARLRGMGERVTGSYDTFNCGCSICRTQTNGSEPPSEHQLPSYLLRRFGPPKLGHAMHALIWITMIELRRRPDRAWELMCDTGIVHELSHWVHGGNFNGGFVREPETLIQRIEDFERSVPGVHPSWAEVQVPMVSTADPGPRYVDPDNSYRAEYIFPTRFSDTYDAKLGDFLIENNQPAKKLKYINPNARITSARKTPR